jgi:hypothetical protein
MVIATGRTMNGSIIIRTIAILGPVKMTIIGKTSRITPDSRGAASYEA